MTYGIVIIIFLIVLALCEVINLYITWQTEQSHNRFKKKVMRILQEHDNLLFPSSPPKLKTKGKVIPYVRPTK